MEHLATAFDEKYIMAEELSAGEDKCELVFKLIHGYVGYPDHAKKQGNVKPKPNS